MTEHRAAIDQGHTYKIGSREALPKKKVRTQFEETNANEKLKELGRQKCHKFSGLWKARWGIVGSKNAFQAPQNGQCCTRAKSQIPKSKPERRSQERK